MNYYVIVPPGLEPIAQWEINYWTAFLEIPVDKIDRRKGGIEVTSDRRFLLLNRYLKSASRILLRICESRRVSSEKELQNLFREIQWPFEFPAGTSQFSVSAHRSRLGHKGHVEDICNGLGLSLDVHFFIRLTEDHLTVSVDTSGDHLHKRGYRPYVGKAPIRENLAAGLLLSTLIDKPLRFSRDIEWVDPMAGSGTLLVEAARLFQGNQTREYSYQSWSGDLPNLQSPSLPESRWSFVGMDRDEKMVEVAQKNWALATDKQAQFFTEDLLSEHTKYQTCTETWIVSNPPYGSRIESGTLDKLLAAAAKFSAHRMSFLVPQKKSIRLPGYKAVMSRNLENGGIPVSWVSFVKK